MKQRANEFVQRMRKEGLTLAIAESITCGLAATKLSSCIGVSEVLTASIVCYTPEAKRQLLGVKKSTIDQCTTESAEVTRQMAEHLPQLIKADVYAALTGLASSDGSESADKPVGTVFYCFRFRGKTHEFRKVFRGVPADIRKKAAFELYRLIIGLLDE